MKRPLLLLSMLVIGLFSYAFPVGTFTSHADSRYVITVYAPDADTRTALVAQGWVPDGVDVRRGTVTLVVNGRGWRRLQTQGWPILDVRPLDFPPVDAAYHTYAEMVDELNRVARQYPNLVQVSTYGKSLEKRDLYVVKISDNVHQDESDHEAGAIIFANIHAREHLTLEQALWAIHHFTENYGRDPAVTNLVNQREIWIMPNTNPDGTEYDIHKTGVYYWWRKNRRPNWDGSFGVDLNRNWGYRWACCGGSSGLPYSEIYRGTAPFSEPETSAIRDFFLAHPGIRVSLSLHTYSELILWPYGYTDDPLPPDMDPTDYAVMRRAGRAMAATNGYRPMQSSELYRTDGTSDDWIYGALRIPCWTAELYPSENPPGFYPPASVIPEQTERNRGMMEYFVALADEPRKILGLAGDVITPTVTLRVEADALPFTTTVQVEDNVGTTLVAVMEGENVLAMASTDIPRPGSATYTLRLPLKPGTHTLQAIAYDAAQNRGTSTPVVVKVGPSPQNPLKIRLPWMMKAVP